MLFHSFTFLVFIAIVYVLVYVVTDNKRQKVIMLLSSYVFYMWWNSAFILLVLYSTIVDFVCGKKIDEATGQNHKRKWLTISLIANLSVLFFFKYFNFFQQSLFYFLPSGDSQPSWTMLNVILPLGISFFTFQSMSYSIDIYRTKLKPIDSFLDFSLYISFFPQMIAGPIIRAVDFLPQLQMGRLLNFSRPVIFLFAKGLFKKVIIADNMNYLTAGIFGDLESYSSLVILLSSIFCYIQIYCDFSGYSDMAIALGRSLGFQFPENFRKPYFARSLSEFWRRWHITLSSWFRDYVYIPMGGNKRRKLFNLFVTMLVFGIWHGAGWNYILLGLMHGLLLIVENVLRLNKGRSMLQLISTQIVFALLLLVFWAKEEGALFTLFDKLLNFNYSLVGLGYLNIYLVTLVAFIFIIIHFIMHDFEHRILKLNAVSYTVFWIFFGLVFYLFAPTYEQPFIYFQF